MREYFIYLGHGYGYLNLDPRSETTKSSLIDLALRSEFLPLALGVLVGAVSTVVLWGLS